MAGVCGWRGSGPKAGREIPGSLAWLFAEFLGDSSPSLNPWALGGPAGNCSSSLGKLTDSSRFLPPEGVRTGVPQETPCVPRDKPCCAKGPATLGKQVREDQEETTAGPWLTMMMF